MNIADSVKFRNKLDAVLALVESFAAQLDRLEQRIDELEAKRGPGRPPNKEKANVV